MEKMVAVLCPPFTLVTTALTKLKVCFTCHRVAGTCPQFTCLTNKYCINQALKCDGQPNCGAHDDSDETAECMYGERRV